ncbi:unnamed protein product, partial [Rotaria socialis]
QKYGTPDKVCGALKFCNNGTQEIIPVESLKIERVPGSPATCALCKYIVGYVDIIIQNNKSEAAIEAALEKVCGILPAAIKPACDQFVVTYGPALFQLIQKYGTPDKVCGALKLCNNGTQTMESIDLIDTVPSKPIKDDPECSLCKYVVSYLDLLIQSNITAAELEKALEFVCTILPSSYQKQCKTFVDTYAPILAELIAELDDPNVVCVWLTLCPKSDDKFIQVPALKINKFKSLPCNLCEYIVNYLDAIIQSNSTETQFEDALDKACKIIPVSQLQSECQTLVHLYGVDLINYLVSHGDPKTVCQKLGLSICLTYTYRPDCAIGPAYWCKSFQNAQDCGALRHCTDTIWRYDEQRISIDSSTKCEWCEKILENTHKAIENVAYNEDLIKFTLLNGCKMLPLEDISSKCTNVVENYRTTVIELMKHKTYDRLCRLMDICQNNEIYTNKEKPYVDTQSKILCNVVVRATQELHCEDLIERHGNEIYAHVVSRVELSKICDYIEDFGIQLASPVGCDMCTFVVSTAKEMLDTKHDEDKVLLYIDEHICSRLTGVLKKNCKQVVDTNGRDLIENLQNGIHPMLLCTHFMYCFDKIVDETSPIQKNEMRSFLMNNICDKLGSFKSACEALLRKDGNALLQVLLNEINGRDLCKIFGLCQHVSFSTYELSVRDDPDQCKRCLTHFIRQKHIAEKLVNHSSEFLHHLCGQLPQKDDCTKAVDDSINELVTFIQSLDPRTVCVDLKMCDPTSLSNIRTTQVVPSDDSIKGDIIEYIKSDVCTKLGSLNLFCHRLADSEGLNLLSLVSKTIDPHRVCSIVDVCPTNPVMKICEDKCQCCTNKVEIYHTKLAKFMEAIVASTRVLCDQVSGRDSCLQLTDRIETNAKKFISRFDSKKACQSLTLCKSSEMKTNEDQCRTCQNDIDQRQHRFLSVINEVTTESLSLCTDNDCRTNVRSQQEEILDTMNNSNSQNLCQHLGYCELDNTYELSSTLLRLRSLAHYQAKNLDERLQSIDVCSDYGQLKSMCEHILVSSQGHRYTNVYMAILKNNPKLIDVDLREQLSIKANADLCGSCKNAIASSKMFLNNALDSILETLIHTCEHCPVKDRCRDSINERVNNIKSYINDNYINADQFCTILGLCKISHPSIAVLPTQSEDEETDLLKDSNSTCILCEYTMKILSNYIHQNSTEQEIEQSLEKICNQMPVTLQKQCHELVDNYGPPIIAVLINDFDLSAICRKLNLCTNQMKVQVSYLTKANQATCGICDYVSTYINFALKRDSSEKSLQHALSTVCHHLLNEQYSQCQTLIQLVAPHIRTLELGLNRNFCQQLTICQIPMSELQPAIDLNQIPSNDKSSIEKDEQFKEIIVKNLDDTPECMLCHYAVSYLDAILKNNKSEAAVEAALEKVCTILPRKERVRCDTFVKNYGPVIAELIADSADPDAICRYLGLCQVVSAQETTTIESAPIVY